MPMTVHNWDLYPKLTEAGVVGMCGVVSLQLFRVSDWQARQGIHKVSRESAMHTETDH
jgi:hypothetical protein